jgi:hypothetical protein
MLLDGAGLQFTEPETDEGNGGGVTPVAGGRGTFEGSADGTMSIPGDSDGGVVGTPAGSGGGELPAPAAAHGDALGDGAGSASTRETPSAALATINAAIANAVTFMQFLRC